MSKEFFVAVIASLVAFAAFEHFVLVEGYKEMVDRLLHSYTTPAAEPAVVAQRYFHEPQP